MTDIFDMHPEKNPILDLEVPLIVQIASRSMAVGEVMELEHGSIIEFPRSADEELAILVNNKSVGQGTAVKVVRTSVFGSRTSEASSPVCQRAPPLRSRQPLRPRILRPTKQFEPTGRING